MVGKWRSIFTEVGELTDVTTGRFAQLQSEVLLAISNVNPNMEYQPFTETYKSSPPEPITFEFAKDIIGEGIGSLQPGQLAVDSLTVEALRMKLGELEHQLKEVNSELKSKQNLLNQHETEIINIQKNTQDISISAK
ncbi:UNVERIFIED_CONTAM: hypothetical protein RMT77_016407 [Armadillidium vulgare]